MLTFKSASSKLVLDSCLVLPVTGYVLDAVGILLERGIGVVRDLEGDWRLSPGQQGHVMSLLQQLASKVNADEARPSCTAGESLKMIPPLQHVLGFIS